MPNPTVECPAALTVETEVKAAFEEVALSPGIKFFPRESFQRFVLYLGENLLPITPPERTGATSKTLSSRGLVHQHWRRENAGAG
jgi:hypothetical protein